MFAGTQWQPARGSDLPVSSPTLPTALHLPPIPICEDGAQQVPDSWLSRSVRCDSCRYTGDTFRRNLKDKL